MNYVQFMIIVMMLSFIMGLLVDDLDKRESLLNEVRELKTVCNK